MKSYSSIPTEELVRRCSASGNTDAWEEFVRRFHRLIATVVLRTATTLGDSSRQTADDLIQETYLKLCADNFRLLRSFEQRSPDGFTGYVKVVTANVVRDYFKALHSQKRRASLVEELPESNALPAGEWSGGSAMRIERELLIRDVQRHLDFCVTGADRERKCTVFWLYYRVGLSASAIAALPEIGLTTKGVESLIFRITKDVRERMAAPKRGENREIAANVKGILPA